MAMRAAGDGDRFELRGELGVGATGAVYRVLDRGTGHDLALKTLRRVSGSDLYRFKREFRALAGIQHPNLVTLHELFVVGDEWMFTMELIEGVSFDRWVRREAAQLALDDLDDATVKVARRGPSAGGLDEPRLRAAVRQLADGVHALHTLGKVHRDLKPSNVLVEASGRTVILDFGLIAESHGTDRTHEQGTVGTVAYMSPEQSADLPLGPASDWYAVGVMLYEGLTGHRPFRGAAHDVMLRKQHEAPPPPSRLADGVPADLDALCMALLARDPDQRPDGAAVLAALGGAPSAATQALIAQGVRRRPGVDPAALAAVRAALAASRDHMVIAVVIGTDGSGRAELTETILGEVRAAGGLAITGTDNHREQTRLPGLDQALDQLSAHLVNLPRAEADAIIADAAPLARLFPALRRLPALQAPTLPQARTLSPERLFRDGIIALRRVFTRVAAPRPFVMAVDDAAGPSGTDARLFTEHFVDAVMPRMLLLITQPPEVAARSEILADFRRWRDEHGGDLRIIKLGELGAADAPSSG